jgi:ribosomal protein S17E
MGKAVPRSIKLRASQLIEMFPEKVSVDFTKNKEFINSLELPFAKSTRNLIAGFISRTLKKAESS